MLTVQLESWSVYYFRPKATWGLGPQPRGSGATNLHPESSWGFVASSAPLYRFSPYFIPGWALPFFPFASQSSHAPSPLPLLCSHVPEPLPTKGDLCFPLSLFKMIVNNKFFLTIREDISKWHFSRKGSELGLHLEKGGFSSTCVGLTRDSCLCPQPAVSSTFCCLFINPYCNYNILSVQWSCSHCRSCWGL
jgi:hypothetical protein